MTEPLFDVAALDAVRRLVSADPGSVVLSTDRPVETVVVSPRYL